MSKKHFIELADMIRSVKPSEGNEIAFAQWERTVDALANFCQAQNSQFKRVRWFNYIDGRCGPSGGAVKLQKAA